MGDNFKNEMMHGQGKLEWDNGAASYEGDWALGRRTGTGTMNYRDKSSFVGEWQDNRRIKGTMTYPGKGTFTGSFAENVGKYTWPSGNYYEGEW